MQLHVQNLLIDVNGCGIIFKNPYMCINWKVPPLKRGVMCKSSINFLCLFFFYSSTFNVHNLLQPRSGRRGRASPYEKRRSLSAGFSWTHKFVCLGQTDTENTPNPQDKYTLRTAGLGEKKLVFKLSGNYAHIKEVILEAFPLLEKGGGFELSRTSGPYSRKLRPLITAFSHLSQSSRNLLIK